MTSLIVGIVSSIGVCYAILQGVLSDKENRKSDFSKMLYDYSHDLKDARDKTSTLKTLEDCETYIAEVNNILDRLAYLYDKKKVNDDFINYFDWWFSYGLRLIDWKVYYFKNKKLYNLWSNLVNYANSRKLKGRGDVPDALMEVLMEEHPVILEKITINKFKINDVFDFISSENSKLSTEDKT